MAKKNKLDDPDSLDEFDLDFGDDDLDIFNPDVKNDRTAVQKAAHGLGSAFDPRKNSLHMAKSVGFAALPKSYEHAFNEITNIKDDISSMYQTTAREFDPVFRQLKSIAKSTIGVTGKILPKRLVDKINASDDSESSHSSSSNYDANTSEINASLDAVFGAQRQQADYQDKKDTVHKQYTDKLGRKQFEYSAGIQSTIANSLSRIVGYQDTVLDHYYRKSLELQHRQFFATRDLLDLQKASAASTIQYLANIQKNTSLPDAVKIKDSEIFKNLTQQKIIGAIQDSSRNQLRNLTRNLRAGIEREASNFAQSFTMGQDTMSSMFGQNDGGFDMGDEFDPNYVLAQGAGNEFISTYGGKLGLKLKGKIPKWLGKIHPEAYNKLEAGGQTLSRLTNDYPAIMNRKMRESNGEGIWGLLSGLMGGPTSIFNETINKNLMRDAVEPVSWDIISRRTLIDVIPGYLSRHLEKMTDIYDVLTGNQTKSDRIVYSAKHEKFITQRQAIASAGQDTRRQFSTNIHSGANAILDAIDDGTLTKSDRALMAVQLARDAADNIEFDPVRYTNSLNLPSGVSDHVAELFRDKFNITTDFGSTKGRVRFDEATQKLHTDLSQRFNDIRSGMGSFDQTLAEHYSVGDTETLSKLGLVNKDGYVDEDYRWNLIKEMMQYDNPYDFFKQQVDDMGAETRTGSMAFNPLSLNRPSRTPGASFDGSMFEPLVNSVDRLTNGLMPLMAKVTADDEGASRLNFDPLTKLVDQQEAHSTKQYEYLDRLVHAVENIQNVSLTEVVGDPQVKTSLLRKMFKLPVKYLKANWKIYQGLAPFRKALYSNALTGAGMLGRGALSLGGLGLRGAKGLGGLLTSMVGQGAKRLPGQLSFMSSLLGSLLSGGMELGKKGVGLGVGLGKSGLDFGWNLLQGLPGAFGRDGRIMKSLIGHGANAGSYLSKGATGIFDKLAGWGLNRENTLGKATSYYGRAKDYVKDKYAGFDHHQVLDNIKSKDWYGKAKDQLSDIYVKGQNLQPVLTIKGMLNREYFDQASGKVIESYHDIKGVVVDKVGNVVLSASDFFTGLVDKNGKSYREHLTEAYANLKKYMPDNVSSLFKGENSIFSKAGGLFEKTYVIKDVYVKGEHTPRLLAEKLKSGLYADAKSGKPIKSIHHIRGDVVDLENGRIVLSKVDFDLGLVDVGGKPIKGISTAHKAFELGKGLFKHTKNSFTNPFGAMGTALAKGFEVLGHRDGDILKVLNDIYGYMKSAFPVQDGETREANRVGGVADILRRRSEARLGKGGKAGATTAAGVIANAGSPIGSTPNGGEKPKASPEGGLVDKGMGFVKDHVVEAAGGGWAAFKAGKWLMPAAKAGGTLASGGEVVAAGAGLSATALAALGLAAAYAHKVVMDYTVDAAHGAIHRRKTMQPLEQLRFMQYGTPMENSDAVKTMQNFEADMMGNITVSMTDKPKMSKTVEEIWAKHCSRFGYPESDKKGFVKFTTWFLNRFLPVYVKHTVVADGYGLKLYDLDTRAGIHDKLQITNALQFTGADSARGVSPLRVTSSPWAELSLADNTLAIEGLSDQIREASKSGINAKKENLKPTKPKEKDKDDKDKTIPQDANQMAKEKLRRDLDNAAKKSLIGRAMGGIKDFLHGVKDGVSGMIDWGKVNLMPTAKRVFDASKSAINDVAKGGIGAISGTKAGKWLNTNVIKPAANTLAALIQGGESGKASYNAYNRGTVGGKILGPVGPRDLTKMTIAEIMADQARPISDEKRLFAVGKYQMITSTLKDAVKALGIDPTTTIFDEATQERLFSGYLMDIKRRSISSYIKGKNDDLKGAVNAAASEWASIADPDTGRSKYGHGNSASISAESMMGAMSKSRELYKQFIAKGYSEEEAYQRALSTDPSTMAAGEDLKSTSPTPTLASATETPAVKPPVGGPLADFGKTKAGNALPSTNNPWASAPVDKTDDTLTPPVTASAEMPAPDLSHISKATLSVGETAQAQRDKQLTEQQKTNMLLEQLIKSGASNMASQANPAQQVSVKMPEKPVQIKPIVNLERSTS